MTSTEPRSGSEQKADGMDGEPILRGPYNGHTLELGETDWRCIHCGHWFDAATDANGWPCGTPCVHPEASA